MNPTIDGPNAPAGVWRVLRFTPMRDLLRGRVTGRLNVRAIIAAANLPAPLAELVRSVVTRSRLWRLEKADVALELVCHFAEGLDAGTSPVDLVDRFGDPVRAAKLIRRAKKRNRPIAWRAMARTA
ncbi:MAG: hypothetical protein KAS72_12155 [Phycisphaerales bacterium]|nr:hypothetical protein [Phycisphaerales bacterium]